MTQFLIDRSSGRMIALHLRAQRMKIIYLHNNIEGMKLTTSNNNYF